MKYYIKGAPYGVQTKPFKRLLIENADKPMQEQKGVLNKAYKDWKGDLEQVDDVLIIGIKL